MLVWTQPIYGIEEPMGISWPRFRLPAIDSRGWVVLGLSPLFLGVLYGVWPLRFYQPVSGVTASVFLLLIMFSKYFVIDLPGKFYFDLETVTVFASFFVIGPFWTFVETVVAEVWYEIFAAGKTRVWTRFFNIEEVLIATGVSAILYGVVSPAWGSFAALLLVGCLYPLINGFLVTLYHAVIRNETNLWAIWQESEFSFICGMYILCVLSGYLLGRVFLYSPLLIVLFALPLALMYLASKSFFDVKQEIGVALQVFGDLLEERDDGTFGHTLRVANYARLLALELGLKPEGVDMCVRVGKLHDIGKIAVPDDVLKKEGGLSQQEYQQMKKHVEMIPELFPHMDRFGKMLHIAMCHHEKFDGTGYPMGLKGDQIPLEARIVAVADAWDAMTTDRCYRPGLPEEKALRILLDHAGKQWDPAVVNAFVQIYEKGLCRPVKEEAA